MGPFLIDSFLWLKSHAYLLKDISENRKREYEN
jgi:hypothetical protein